MSSSRRWFVYAVALAAAIASLARAESPAKGGAAEARTAIEAANAKFAEAFGRGDTAAVAGMYTRDAIVFPPDAEMVKGREAIGQFWKKSLEGGVKSVTLTTIDVGRSGDAAYETGKVMLSVQPEGKEAATVAAKYLVVWKREGGSWKLHRDIWNALPAGK